MQDQLDFAELMDVAHRNNEDNSITSQVRRYNLEFTKKKDDGSKVDPRAIQRVLAEKKRDEIRQRVEEQRKKERLMAERAQNRKAHGRISSMLKRTKSAMKGAVLAEEAVAAVVAEDQIQADDFGYTSTYADKIHASLMKKYVEQPVPDKFGQKKRPASNMEATKARMKQAIDEDEDDICPRRKKPPTSISPPSSKTPDFPKPVEKERKSRKEEELEKQRKKYLSKPQPPPMSYAQLMAIAASKKDEPVKVTPVVEELPKIPKREYEFDRPMTAKEKEEFLREKEAKLRREGKLPPKPPTVPKPGPLKVEVVKRVTPGGEKQEVKKVTPGGEKQAVVKKVVQEVKMAPKPGPASKTRPEPPRLKKPEPQVAKRPPVEPQGAKKPPMEPKPKPQPPKMAPKPSTSKIPARTDPYVPKKVTEQYIPQRVTGTYVPKPVGKAKPDGTTYKATKIAPKPGQSKAPTQAGGSKVAGKPGAGPVVGQKRPMDPWSRLAAERQAQMAAKKAKPVSARPRIESDSEEEEYDSEMDDFIDDGPLENELDVSQEISRLFGYDRRRYANLDEEDEDECMESSFGQQLKEEFISTKAGILEDLKEARLQKMQKMKQKKK